LRPNFAAASNLSTLLFFDEQLKRSAEIFRQAVSLDRAVSGVGTSPQRSTRPAGATKVSRA
jgi:hypothetical protein